ncbi:MAG TPA: hypothetical protein VIL86_14660 [Tepidisphaeraceae bacterium]|jgi:uncharacterized glyoxalase superfamily protein PhnB
MSTIRLTIPDDVKAIAEARAAEAGHSDIARYIESLIRLDAAGKDYGAPASLSFSNDDELEALLQEAIDGGQAREIADGDWGEKRRRLIERHRPNTL